MRITLTAKLLPHALPTRGAMIRSMIRSRRHRGIRMLVDAAVLLAAALAIVSRARMDCQVRGIEQFAAGDAR